MFPTKKALSGAGATGQGFKGNAPMAGRLHANYLRSPQKVCSVSDLPTRMMAQAAIRFTPDA
jgi:hypothetical protein